MEEQEKVTYKLNFMSKLTVGFFYDSCDLTREKYSYRLVETKLVFECSSNHSKCWSPDQNIKNLDSILIQQQQDNAIQIR